MKATKRILLILTAALLAALLTASLVSCGSASMGGATKEDAYISNSNEGYYGSSYEKPSEDASGAVADGAQYQEKIIKTVFISGQTKQFDAAISSIRSELAAVGGFEESFTSSGKSYSSSEYYCRDARMVLRVPAEKLDAFLGKVGDLVNVVREESTKSNVTAEYYDIASRVNVLESEKAVYEKMLSETKDITQLLEIERRLYDTIAEIEAYKTRLNVYDSKVSYSTVTISLNEVIEYSSVTPAKATFGERIKTAFTESWKDFVVGCKDFAVWLVYALPTILVLAVIVSAALLIIKASKSKKKKKQTTPAPIEEVKEDKKDK